MKKSLLIIAVALATSTGLPATPLLNVTVADSPTGNTTISAYLDDKLGFSSSDYVNASISKASLGASFATQSENISSTVSSPHMNRPGGSYTSVDTNEVPDGGLTALLLGLGIVGLILLARRDAVVRKNN